MAKYIVLARIEGVDEPAAFIAGPYPSEAAAEKAAAAQQRQIPDPEEGDVVFYAQRLEEDQ